MKAPSSLHAPGGFPSLGECTQRAATGVGQGGGLGKSGWLRMIQNDI